MAEHDQIESAVIDLERWPLVIIRPPSGVTDDGPELDAFYRTIEQTVLARRRPYVVLYDVRGVKTSGNRRERMGEWTAAHDAEIRTYMIALAVVISTELERADVMAGFWNLKQSYHARIFEDAADAESWLLAEFARGEGAN